MLWFDYRSLSLKHYGCWKTIESSRALHTFIISSTNTCTIDVCVCACGANSHGVHSHVDQSVTSTDSSLPRCERQLLAFHTLGNGSGEHNRACQSSLVRVSIIHYPTNNHVNHVPCRRLGAGDFMTAPTRAGTSYVHFPSLAVIETWTAMGWPREMHPLDGITNQLELLFGIRDRDFFFQQLLAGR